MNNLKRILSLAVAGVMLVGMMVVGAGAVEFHDGDEIVHKDAVDTMVALNILTGGTDGNFQPNGNVTRAQMATIIARAQAVPSGFAGTAGSPFTDVQDSHYAKDFIVYCSNLGIIAGDGLGNFAPDANVTGLAAAKMALVALGYDPKDSKTPLEGYTWATNTLKLANECSPKLFYGLDGIDVNEPLTRDQASQLVWNAMQNNVVSGTNLSIGEGGVLQVNRTTWLNKYFGINQEYAVMTGASTKDGKTYTYTFDADGITDGALTATGDITFGEDVSALFGQKVKVVYKPDSNSKAEKVYGIFSASDVLASALWGDMTPNDEGTAVTIGKTTYKLEDDFDNVLEFNNPDADTPDVDEEYYTADLIDNDNNGKVDTIVVHPFKVGQITYIGSKTFTFTEAGGSGSSKKIAESALYEGYAKNDYVKMTPAANTVTGEDTFEKLEAAKGEVSATRSEGAEIRVDGKWYTLTSAVSGTPVAGTELGTLVVVNGYAFVADEAEATESTNYALVTDAADKYGLGNKPQAVLLLTDGTSETVTAKEDYTSLKGKLVTYTVKSGVYTLTAVATDEENGVTVPADDSPADITDGKIETTTIADDAVIFVDGGDDGYSVITGKELKAKGTAKATAYVAATSKTTGYDSITLAYVNGIEAAAGNYGYVVSDVITVKDGAMEFTLFTGSETPIEVTATLGDGVTGEIAKGSVIDFSKDSDNEITVKAIYSLEHDATADNTKMGAIVAYNGSNAMRLNNKAATETVGEDTKNVIGKEPADGDLTDYKITDNTVILTVNVADTEGVVGDKLAMASKTAEGNYIANAFVLAADDTAKLIVYSNDLWGYNG